MILKGDLKKAAYAKNNPQDYSFEELVTILCTSDGKGPEYKLQCIRVLLSYDDPYLYNFREIIDNYFETRNNKE